MTKINTFNPNTVANSILSVKASGSINDQVINDLLLDNGKSIAELLHDQEKDESDKRPS